MVCILLLWQFNHIFIFIFAPIFGFINCFFLTFALGFFFSRYLFIAPHPRMTTFRFVCLLRSFQNLFFRPNGNRYTTHCTINHEDKELCLFFFPLSFLSLSPSFSLSYFLSFSLSLLLFYSLFLSLYFFFSLSVCLFFGPHIC